MDRKDLDFIKNASASELIENQIDCERLEVIPVSNIIIESDDEDGGKYGGSIVDTTHVDELAKSIKGKRGQISPLVVRARNGDEGRIVYDIIDGFHRANALKKIGRETANAVVLYSCDDEELYDLRLLAVNSVKSVRFARTASWMEMSFKNSEWDGRGLTLLQVFSVVGNNTSGIYLGINPEERQRLEAWVEDKVKKWQKSATTIIQDLTILDIAAPDLVLQVRTSGGGKEGKGVLTRARLKEIVDACGKDYDLQRRVAAIVVEKNVLADDIRRVAPLIAKFRGDNEKLFVALTDPNGMGAELIRLVDEDDDEFEEADNRETISSDSSDKFIEKETGVKVNAKRHEVVYEGSVNPIQSGETPSGKPDGAHSNKSLSNGTMATEKADSKTPVSLTSLQTYHRVGASRSIGKYENRPTEKDYIREIELLKGTIASLQENKMSADGRWWHHVDLPLQEREAIILAEEQDFSLADIAKSLGVTEHRAESLITSAMQRYLLSIAEGLHKQKIKIIGRTPKAYRQDD